MEDRRVVTCERRDIASLLTQARGELVFGPERNVVWFRVVGEPAFAGLRKIGRWRWRLFNCWVAPEQRGSGIGSALVEARIAYAQIQGAHVIDVRSRRPETFARLGFVVGRSYLCGVTHCEMQVGVVSPS